MSFGRFSLDIRACVPTSRRTAATSPGARRDATTVRRRGFAFFVLMPPVMPLHAGARSFAFSTTGPGAPLHDVQTALRLVTFRCALMFAAAGSLHRPTSHTWVFVNTTRAGTGVAPLTTNVPAGQGTGLDRVPSANTTQRTLRMMPKPAMRRIHPLYVRPAHQSRSAAPLSPPIAGAVPGR